MVTLSWNTIIFASSVIAAAMLLVSYFAKVVRWVDKQKKQDDGNQSDQGGADNNRLWRTGLP